MTIPRFAFFLFSWLLLSGLILTHTAIRFNHTPSVPIGLYVLDPRGQFVEFCPPEPAASLSRDRKYRAPHLVGPGCRDQFEPLFKRIVAKEGDTVELSVEGVRINGTLWERSAARPVDTQGRKMTHYPFGSHVMRTGEYWVMGDHAYSFDSRYYGPIDAENTTRFDPLFTH